MSFWRIVIKIAIDTINQMSFSISLILKVFKIVSSESLQNIWSHMFFFVCCVCQDCKLPDWGFGDLGASKIWVFADLGCGGCSKRQFLWPILAIAILARLRLSVQNQHIPDLDLIYANEVQKWFMWLLDFPTWQSANSHQNFPLFFSP